jgi:hypothetical protein
MVTFWHRTVLIAVCLLPPTTCDVLAQQLRDRFDLNSTASTYPFVTRLQGTVAQIGDSLVVLVEGGVVRSQIPTDLQDEGLGRDVSIALGLGYPDSGSWSSELDTKPQLIAPVLAPGASSAIGPLRVVIAGVDTILLADRWLVAQVRVQQRLPGLPPGLIASYACAEENLRGPTTASRARAEAMKKDYSHIC